MLFWTDVWEDGGCFINRFPRIYAIAHDKNARVEEVWSGSGGVGMWNITVTRNLKDWEVEEFENLLLMLSNV